MLQSFYVDNESDAKATLSVNTGSKEVSNYTMRSFSRNTVASDEKHGTNIAEDPCILYSRRYDR